MPKRQHGFAIPVRSRSTSKAGASTPADGALTTSALPRLVDNYLLTGDINRQSEATLAARRDLLGRFIWFLRDHRGHAACARTRSATSCTTSRTATRSQAADAPVHRDDQIRPFTDEQIKALLLAAKRLQHPKRNEALLLLMCDTGLRASEVCGLTVGDLDLDKATSGL